MIIAALPLSPLFSFKSPVALYSCRKRVSTQARDLSICISLPPYLPSTLPIYLSGSSETHGRRPEQAVSLARVNKCNGRSELRAVLPSQSPNPILSVSRSSITRPLGSGLLRPRQLCLAPSNVASISFVLKWL